MGQLSVVTNIEIDRRDRAVVSRYCHGRRARGATNVKVNGRRPTIVRQLTITHESRLQKMSESMLTTAICLVVIQAAPPLARVPVNYLRGTPHPVLHVRVSIEEARDA